MLPPLADLLGGCWEVRNIMCSLLSLGLPRIPFPLAMSEVPGGVGGHQRWGPGPQLRTLSWHSGLLGARRGPNGLAPHGAWKLRLTTGGALTTSRFAGGRESLRPRPRPLSPRGARRGTAALRPSLPCRRWPRDPHRGPRGVPAGAERTLRAGGLPRPGCWLSWRLSSRPRPGPRSLCHGACPVCLEGPSSYSVTRCLQEEALSLAHSRCLWFSEWTEGWQEGW